MGSIHCWQGIAVTGSSTTASAAIRNCDSQQAVTGENKSRLPSFAGIGLDIVDNTSVVKKESSCEYRR